MTSPDLPGSDLPGSDLPGSDRPGSDLPGSGSSGAAHPEAYWEGDTLVTETQRPVNGYTVTVKEARSLGPGGKEMTVQTTVIVQHGYSMPGAKNYGTSKDVFIKATP